MKLPDPRRYGNGADVPLARLAAAGGPRLAPAVAAAVDDARDADIRAAYAAVASRTAYHNLWEAVAAAIEAPAPGAAVVTQVFAMPWLLVCGTRAGGTLPVVLPDAGAVLKALEAGGALGASRNVGLANALTDLDALEALPPGTLKAWNAGAGVRELPPAPVVLAPGEESLHLRFLLGAAVSPPQAAGIADTATNVAAWGMKATAAMAQQLTTPGVNVLPMPRAPMSVMRAAYAGRRTALEAAFSLFLSNTLRRFRAKVGDATLVLSSHEGGELRATLHSPLDEELTEGYRWPLHPLDDLDAIVKSIGEFAAECRVHDVVALADILPDTTPAGAVLFPTAPPEKQ